MTTKIDEAEHTAQRRQMLLSDFWNLGSCIGGNLLEILILRDCMHLKEMEVSNAFTLFIILIHKLNK
ncbi:unnamed protein product [Trifolium pratense]|uniref:Uncharacterized protein n=1 Tax=Trifolium pratense TaxID=57577 RepID=A0ACB0L7B3_TRIPR|nr:unnamed protein product [Trifolium pratense]